MAELVADGRVKFEEEGAIGPEGREAFLSNPAGF